MSGSASLPRTPYPGLRPFEADDHLLFFGREAQVSAMLHQLEEHRFVAVVGSSGSGKSSLVRAGLVPALQEGFLANSSDWMIAILRPGHEPYARLASELLGVASARGSVAAALETAAHLRALMMKSDQGLIAATGALSWSGNTMVIVDQFEELFAFRRQDHQSTDAATRDEAASFTRMLLRASGQPKGRVWVVLTMRSDFIGDCEAFLGLPEAVSQSQFLVPRLDRRQMEEAIRRPGEAAMVGYAPFMFKDELVVRLINDAGDKPDQLPLLQHALMRMWKLAVTEEASGDIASGGKDPLVLTLDHYKNVDGISGALSQHANAAWDTIKDDKKKAYIARAMFLLLCDVSVDGQITRRRPTMEEICAVATASISDVEEILRLFNNDDRNFIVYDQPLQKTSRIDISHEALLRQWNQFANLWLGDERTNLFELKLLAELSTHGIGGAMSSTHLARANAWRTRVTEVWALRYVSVDDWKRVLEFIESSGKDLRKKHRVLQATALGFGTALLVTTAWALNAAHLAEVVSKSNQQMAVDADLLRRDAESAKERISEEQDKTKAALTTLGEVNVVLEKKNGEAERALTLAQQATHQVKASGFWNNLGSNVSSPSASAKEGEESTLLQLAQSPLAVRLYFLEGGILTPALAKRIASNPSPLIEASVGTSPTMRRLALENLSRSRVPSKDHEDVARAREVLRVVLHANDLNAVLSELRVCSDDLFKYLGSRLSILAQREPVATLAPLLDRLLSEAANARSPKQRAAYGLTLTRLAGRVMPEQAFSVSQSLVAAISQTTDDAFLQQLSNATVSAVRQVPDQQKPAMKELLVVEFIKESAGPFARRTALANALLPVASSNIPLSNPKHEVKALIFASQGTDELSRTEANNAFALLISRLDQHLIRSTAIELLEGVKSTINPRALGVLGPALSAALDRLPVSEMDTRVHELLELIGEREDSDQLHALGLSLGAAVRQMPSDQREATADRLIRQWVGGDNRTRRAAYGHGLLAAAQTVPKPQALSLVERMVSEVDRGQGKGDLSDLGRMMEAAALRLPVDKMEAAVNRIIGSLAVIRDRGGRGALGRGLAAIGFNVPKLSTWDALLETCSGAPDPDRARALGNGLAAIIAASAAPDAEAMHTLLLQEFRADRDLTCRAAMGYALAAAAPHVTPARAEAIAATLIGDIKVHAAATDKTKNSLGVLRLYGVALGPYAAKVPDTQVPALADALIEASKASALKSLDLRWLALDSPIDMSDSTIRASLERLSGPPALFFSSDVSRLLGGGLETAAKRHSPEEVSARVDGLLRTMDAADSGNQLLILGGYMEKLAARLPATQSAAYVDRILSAVNTTTHRTTPGASRTPGIVAPHIKALMSCLNVLIARMPDDQLERLTTTLVAATKTCTYECRQPIGDTLLIVLGRLSNDQLAAQSGRMIRELLNQPDAGRIRMLGRGLVFALSRVEPRDVNLGEIIEILKYPSAPRAELVDALGKLHPNMPRNRGDQVAIEWLAIHHSTKTDLDAPAIR